MEDIEELPEGVRAELIDGQMFYMATPSRKHQGLVGNLFGEIFAYLNQNKGKCAVYPAPFAVYLNEDNRTYLEPDITVVCDRDKLDDRGCHGAPDFVAEILSPSSRSRDCLLKLIRYREAGVREYWIVDPERETVMVYDFAENKVGSYTFGDKVRVNLFPGLEIDFGGMDLS